MRAAVYSRESKGNAASVSRQREDAVALAEQRGYEVVAVLGDADTSAAGKRARPDFDKLLVMARSGHVGAIVAWSWDRLERNRRDGLRLIETCQAHGVVIALVRGSDIDMTTPAGRMTADILASVARHEIEQKADRTNRAQLQAAEAGKPPARRAFGYRQDGTIDPVEGPAVRQAFETLLAGGSIVGIRKWLNEQKLVTTGGKVWSNAAVRAMLRRARYAGIRVFQGVEIGPGAWKSIVSEDVYRAAVDLLDEPSRATYNGSHARKHLGAALYLCGRCAENDVTTTMTTAYRIYGDYKRRIYQCRISKHLSRVAEPIDDLVERVMVAKLRSEDIGSLLAKRSPDVGPLRTEAQALRTRREALARDLSIDERTLALRDRALGERLAEVEQALAEAGRTSALAALASAPDPGQAWLDLDDLGARQAVVRECFTITLLPGRTGNRDFDPHTVSFDDPSRT